MHCPVCPNANIPPEQTSCANCGADVTPIRRMQELPARWFNEALASLRGGDTGAAIAKLFSASEIDPQSVTIRRVLGKALWIAGRTQEAHAQWSTIADRDDEAKALLAMRARSSRVPAIAAIVILAIIAIGAVIMATRPRQVIQASVVPVERRALSPPKAAAEPAAGRRAGASRYPAIESREDVRIDRDGDVLRVTFREGLFPAGSDVAFPAAKTKLEAIARELSSAHVEVEGFTDSNPPPRDGRWADNWSLAFGRARAAVEIMRPLSGSDVTWSASSSGDRQTPYPASQSNNRTVVLRIAARERRSP